MMMQANEDCNCYSYDSRKLDEAKCVHMGHESAVYDRIFLVFSLIDSYCFSYRYLKYLFISFPGWILITHLLVGNLLPDLMIEQWVFLDLLLFHLLTCFINEDEAGCSA